MTALSSLVRRTAQRAWRWFLPQVWQAVWFGSLILCLAWNYASLLEVVPFSSRAYLIGADPNFYCAWSRSLVVDGDIDFANDYAFLARTPGLGQTQDLFVGFLRQDPYTPVGRLANKYGIGMGILSLPLMYLAHLLCRGWEQIAPLEISHFAAAYPLAFLFSAILTTFAGIAVCFRILKETYGARTSFVAVVCGVLGLNLGYYTWFWPDMAHGVSFAANTIFVAIALRWARRFERSKRGAGIGKTVAWAFLMGLALGFGATVRYTNALFFLFPAVLAVAAWRWEGNGQTGAWIGRAALCLWAAVAGTLLGFLPQMVAWKFLYGSYFTYSYSGETIHLFPIHLAKVLFGSVNSLFLWTPLALVACFGLAMAVRRIGRVAAAAAVVLVAEIWVYGGWDWYWLGGSFGMRALADASFCFILGIAEILDRLGAARIRFWRRAIVATPIVALVLWNVYFMIAYRAGLQPIERPFAGRRLLSSPDRWIEQARHDLTVFWRPKYDVFTLSDPSDNGL